MRVFEWGMAALLAAGGVRSAWHWLRHPFDAADLVDHALFALFVMARVGLWLAFSGLFVIYALNDAPGRSFPDATAILRWYLMVLIGLSAVQLVAGFLLGRRTPRAANGQTGDSDGQTGDSNGRTDAASVDGRDPGARL